MNRILTGVQSSGRQHLGNILGAIKPAIELSNNEQNECFYFIADLHSLTTLKDGKTVEENVINTAAAWLALGLDTEKHFFYRQSDIPEVAELTWYLNCITPFPMLANAHSFKDKSENLSDVNAGLFTYPVLMAADIILYDADKVPVGKDQKQHLEMTRDIAGAFNRAYGETFILPEAIIRENVQTIPGTDGRKMSKSYGNVIDVFLPEKQLKKQVMSIVTDSKALDEPKDPSSCNVFQIFKLLAEKDLIEEMEENYKKGGYGYGHAKKALLKLLLEKFKEERSKFDELISEPSKIKEILVAGADKTRVTAQEKLREVRDKTLKN